MKMLMASAIATGLSLYLPPSGRLMNGCSRVVTNGKLCFGKRVRFESFLGTLLLKRPQKHVSSIICSSGADSRDGENNLEKEKRFDEKLLEKALQDAIESENYSEAARLRDQLRAIHDTEMARVIDMNKTFYRAFESGNMKLMRSIWALGENVHCIHPGSGRISGYDMVISSWELMIGSESWLPLKIELHNLEVHVKDSLAYVTCLEIVRTQGSSWGKQLATNIFEKRDGKWYICMHHASYTTV